MSRHRMKTLSYDDDDFDEDDYEADPEEQELLEQYTSEVLNQLRVGQPSVSASREEIQEALWHYYNDMEKSVNYLRNKKAKELKKQQPAPAAKSKGSAVPAYPAPPISFASCSAHLSAAEFFRDSPWLNIPPHRKADILVEPLYPRLGLLGGAPESGGKMSKLAALAAARKKKEAGKAAAASPGPADQPPTETPREPTVSSLTLQERLFGNAKDQRSGETGSGLRSLGKGLKGPRTGPKEPSPQPEKQEEPKETQTISSPNEYSPKDEEEDKRLPATADIKAPPSTFASVIVGDTTHPATPEPSHLVSNSIDVMKVYGQDLTEVFDFTGPSPDDVVQNAQSASKGLKAKQGASKPAGDKKKQAELAAGMKALAVEEPVNVKSKNLDVLAEYKKSQAKKAANFVVIGHVDAGKSTLMGRLLSDLNAVDQRTLEKYRKEAEKIGKGSFALAWVLDQSSEERARGVTIDIATNKFETEKTRFTIVDAPGHRDFVPNMIAGASQADFAVLVIDSSTGNFESGLKGQTKEHALLVRSMGVHKIVVAVNKMDSVDWSKDRYEEIEQQISSFLTTAGFQEKNISFVPCSGFHGDNITRRSDNPNASWYTGRTLIEELETSEPYTHALEKPLRMTIADVFRGGVQSPVSISGRLDAGSLQVGDQILTMPSGEKAVIKSLEVDGEPNDWAVAGQNVVLNLANIDPIHLRSGDVICTPASPVQNITTFTTKVLAFDHLMPMLVDIHRGRLHVPGRISRLVATLDKGTGTPVKKRPKIIPPGTVARIVVEMDQAIPLETPARIVLRASGDTIAAGLLE
ncbi:elongation factor Tu GTP binding domain protein [Paecilomyces variotii No. 5]|uniref:Elongation factor 1 alpha-like protein n=1 Tax=Byssochlamys spectabilis (strain No. 5 / NBRC 109023) TaxID=1356009 RepID=V5FF18_BYSSN|nr:elongation factor Tu GTP binding domain protein [Paecilomyces variotii No. 5]